MSNSHFARIALAASVTCAAALSGVPTAFAGGLELVGQGPISVGRGGAVTARADDPLVLAHNPAGLAELRGQQLHISFALALFNACVDPAGYYGWGTYLGGKASRFIDPKTGNEEALRLAAIDNSTGTPIAVEHDYYREPYDTVCLEQNITPIPQLAWSARVTEDFGIGFGFIFPQAQPSGNWGAHGSGLIRGRSGELRPAPTRYQLLSSANLGAFPTLGFGYRVFDALRIGAAFEWGIIAINNYTMSAALGGTSPSNDIVSHVIAQDWFVPGITASVHLVPVDAIDVVVAFRWQDAINAKGVADLTGGSFDPQFVPSRVSNFEINSVRMNLPWKLRAGIRYADRLAPRPSGTGSDESDFASGETIQDSLGTERWDIELDVEYQANSVNQEQVVDFVDGQRIEFQPVIPAAPGSTLPNAMIPNEVRIQKRWQDQVSVRLGGTYNILPNLLGISAGAHYETRGIDADYMQVDFWPLSRIGLHTGVIFRVSNALDIAISYAHIFQETLIVAPPAHRARQDVYDEYIATGGANGGVVNGIDHSVGVPLDRTGAGVEVITPPSQGTPDGTARVQQIVSNTAEGQPPYVTNAGRYRSSFDMVSVGVNVHF